MVVCTGACWSLYQIQALICVLHFSQVISTGHNCHPLILSSDKALLTLFHGKSAYSVYLTIGNIPKQICHKPLRGAQMVIGYIPTTKLEGISNQAACRRSLANLFHACMNRLLTPIHLYGERGLAMMSSDGTWHQCHPILAAFVATIQNKHW